jgi:cytochrome c-type biogenesis protein CcmH/NrfG
MGTVLLRAGIYDRAEREFRAVQAIEPDDDAAILGLAAAVRGLGSRDNTGRYVEAEKLLKSLLDRKPHHVAAQLNLAVLYADFLNERDRAKPLFEAFLDDAPKNEPGRAVAEKWLADNKAASAAPPPPKK